MCELLWADPQEQVRTCKQITDFTYSLSFKTSYSLVELPQREVLVFLLAQMLPKDFYHTTI
jgi:hypothetical protein